MVIKEGYKQTEIGVIPKDWEVKTLGDVLKIKHGRDQKQVQSTNGKYPILGTGGLMGFTDKFLYDKESVLIGRKGTIDKPRYMNTPFWTVDTLFYSEIFKENSAKYLYYNFLKIDWYSYNEASGVPSLNAKTIENISIPIPPLAEQTAIAIALADADGLIKGLEKLIAKKQNIKQGAMQQLLQPKEGWEVRKLGEVCDVRDGTHESPQYFESGVTFITSKNIIKAKLDFKDISFISEGDAYLVNQRSKVDKGDILMSMIGTIGNAVLIDFEPEFCIKNIALLKPKKINENFLIQLIHSTSFQKYIESKLDGGIQKFISLGVLRELEIPVPNFIEQTRIATILSDMDAELSALEQKLEKYKKIKLGMMQELLTGKTRLV